MRYLPLFLLLIACSSQSTLDNSTSYPDLDPRLAKFYDRTINDTEARERVKRSSNNKDITLEVIIYAMFTGRTRFDTTPDNRLALAQLGEYLEVERPPLSKILLTEMESFLATPANQTMIRGMITNTVRGIVAGN